MPSDTTTTCRPSPTRLPRIPASRPQPRSSSRLRSGPRSGSMRVAGMPPLGVRARRYGARHRRHLVDEQNGKQREVKPAERVLTSLCFPPDDSPGEPYAILCTPAWHAPSPAADHRLHGDEAPRCAAPASVPSLFGHVVLHPTPLNRRSPRRSDAARCRHPLG